MIIFVINKTVRVPFRVENKQYTLLLCIINLMMAVKLNVIQIKRRLLFKGKDYSKTCLLKELWYIYLFVQGDLIVWTLIISVHLSYIYMCMLMYYTSVYYSTLELLV